MIALPHFPRKRFELRHSKICKKLKNVLFKGSEHSGFTGLLRNYFLKCLPWRTLDSKTFDLLCLAVTINGFNFMTQKCAKSWKLPFSKVQYCIYFWREVSFKTIYWNVFYVRLQIYTALYALSCFPKKYFQLFRWKMCIKIKKSIFKHSEQSFLTSR